MIHEGGSNTPIIIAMAGNITGWNSISQKPWHQATYKNHVWRV